MRKVIYILPLLLLLDSCSISKRSSGSSEAFNSTIKDIEGRISDGNLTRNNFFVERADIEINSQGSIQNVMATLKYELPGVYLISIRSKTGIEAARIFITKDSVLINDRINRILYYGATNVLSMKYGIDYSLLPVIFGDIILRDDTVLDNKECEGGFRNISENFKGKLIQYSFDCKAGKLSETTIKGNMPGSYILLIYKSFIKNDSGIHPTVINLEYLEKQLKIQVKIKKINFNYEGKIDFIPGAKYERRELL